MGWILVEKPPIKHGNYWCFPVPCPKGYCALYWDGKEFSNGDYKPTGITHYREMILEYPAAPTTSS